MKFNWKTAGLLGFIGAIIALPITIWKTSRLGRIVYIAVFVIVILKLIAISIDELITSYVRVQRAVAVAQRLDPVFKDIAAIEQDIASTNDLLRHFKDRIDQMANNKRHEYEITVKDEADKALALIEEAYKGAEVIKEDERRALKTEIIRLREEVKINKRSIDESAIRERLETIADTRFLLTDEEKKRFNKDLEEIGFKVEKTQENAVRIFSDRWSVTSMDAVSYMPISSDGVAAVYYHNDDRRYN